MGRRRLPEIPVRTDWHQSASGCWSLTLGERGCRVRIEQREPGGTFSRVTWIPEKGRSQASLRTKDRREARARGEAFLRALLEGEPAAPDKPLTLGELVTRYQQEAPAYRQNTRRTQAEKRARSKLLKLGLGANTRVERLTLDSIARYSELRRRGTGWPDGRETKPVRARSVAYDLQILRAMIRWACTVRKPDGTWLLPENPLRGMSIPREASPKRPVATHDRFLAVRKAVGELQDSAESEEDRRTWIRLELALVLAEATGRRIGAVAGLRWDDFDFEAPTITWRAEFDKRRKEATIPVPAALAEEVRTFRARLQAFDGGWLFPLETKDRPWHRTVFDGLLRTAEKKAKVTPLEGGLWHPYRRKWATERKNLPTVDVMKAGGWADRTTMETCYQQATDAGVLEAMASPVKLREAKAGGNR